MKTTKKQLLGMLSLLVMSISRLQATPPAQEDAKKALMPKRVLQLRQEANSKTAVQTFGTRPAKGLMQPSSTQTVSSQASMVNASPDENRVHLEVQNPLQQTPETFNINDETTGQ